MPTKTEIKADIIVEFSSARVGKKKEQCLKVTTTPILDINAFLLDDNQPMHHVGKFDDAQGRFSIVSSLGEGLQNLKECCDEMIAEGKTHPLEPFFSGEKDELVIVIRRKRAKKMSEFGVKKMDIFEICNENKKTIIFIESETRSFVTWNGSDLMEIWFETEPGDNKFQCQISKYVTTFYTEEMAALAVEGKSFYSEYMDELSGSPRASRRRAARAPRRPWQT